MIKIISSVKSGPFEDAVGLTAGLSAENKGTFTGGIFTLGNALGGSSGIKIDLTTAIGTGTKTSATGSKKLTITYVCKVEEPAAKLTVKDDGTWGGNDVDYADLTVGAIATLEYDETEFVDNSTVIFLQTNDYENTTAKFYVKITDIKLE